ncbi:MAG: hypothetical protein K6T83_22100 [Alicyclobacillus sp.]|nr:hypothetical protein [Alicyclobacillus sp.]
MRFWLMVNGERHAFVESARCPEKGETLVYKEGSYLVKGTVTSVETLVAGTEFDMARPVQAEIYVYVRKE